MCDRLGKVLGQCVKENDTDWCMFSGTLKGVLLWERQKANSKDRVSLAIIQFHFKTQNLQGWALKLIEMSESKACFEEATPINQISPILCFFSPDTLNSYLKFEWSKAMQMWWQIFLYKFAKAQSTRDALNRMRVVNGKQICVSLLTKKQFSLICCRVVHDLCLWI